MIKITKLEIPEVLLDHAAEWTKVLLDKIASGVKPSDSEKSKYRHPEIKKVLINETRGKCAYCESKLLHVAYGDIEHIIPKSTKVEVSFEWANLTLACDICNTNKRDLFSNGVGFIDPYVNDPAGHFNFIGPLIFAKTGDFNARLTEETLKLNRVELIERRTERIRYLRNQAEVIKSAPDELKLVLMEILNEEIQADKEYSAISRACIPVLLVQ
jgi:HNH endonuclease